MSNVTIRIGERTVTIGSIADPMHARYTIAQMAATIAAGIESAAYAQSNDWTDEDTARKALSIATEIFIATRAGL